jgi:broad specificity phosphatase PhoE
LTVEPTIVLVRHAETVYNVRGLVSGDPDNSACVLSVSGEQQARSLARELSAVAFDLCVTSAFVRTRQTADLVFAGRDVPRLELPDLNELAVGEFEGMSVRDFDAWVETNGGSGAVPPGGESWEQALIRWGRAYAAIAVRPEERLLVVAHQTPLAVLFRALGTDHLSGGSIRNATPYPVARDELLTAIPRLRL